MRSSDPLFNKTLVLLVAITGAASVGLGYLTADWMPFPVVAVGQVM